MTTVATPTIPTTRDATHRRLWIGSEPHALHSHHYNAFLQQTIQDAVYLETTPLLVGAAQEVAHHQLSRLFDAAAIRDVESRKGFAETLYRWAGFGTVDLTGATEAGGQVTSPSSHYSSAWKSKMGVSNQPVDRFGAGWVAGALAAVFDAPSGTFGSRQTSCMAMNAAANTFAIDLTPAYPTFAPIGRGPLTEHVRRATGPSPIDYDAVYEALTSMGMEGDATGIVDAFGIYLTNHYANYHNRISFEFVAKMRDRFGEMGVEMAEPLLVEAGHVCAFHTFGGIMTSAVWDGLIRPSLGSREDQVHGLTAAVNALGWGRWEVTDVSPQAATFVVHDDYESIGYLAGYGASSRPVSYLAEGAAVGIMNLVYVGEGEEKPTFDPSFYQRLFKSGDSFTSAITTSRAGGDDVTTIVVSR